MSLGMKEVGRGGQLEEPVLAFGIAKRAEGQGSNCEWGREDARKPSRKPSTVNKGHKGQVRGAG